jgi:ribosomal protein S18 acetylase RimI-like enzyme
MWTFSVIKNNVLVGIIEINFETWNNRLRITECIVFDNHKRKGIGRALINHVIKKAKELHARAIVLETQTSNIPAICFYQACGFSLIGVDLIAYSNTDVEKDEVRIEFGLVL